MLSKEEIEDSIENKFNDSEEENFGLTVEEAKHIALYEKEIHYCDALTQATYNILLQYIEQLESDKQNLIDELEDKQEEINSLNEFYETYEINHKAQAVFIDRNRFKEVIGADKDFTIFVVNKLPTE